MAEEILSVEMRLTIDKALQQYKDFEAKLKKEFIPVDVKLDLSDALKDAQAKFKKTPLSVELDWGDAHKSVGAFLNKHNKLKIGVELDTVAAFKELGLLEKAAKNITGKVSIDTSDLDKAKKQIIELDRTLIDVGVSVNSASIKTLETQLDKMKSRSIAVNTTSDLASFTALQTALDKLADRTVNISGGGGIGSLKADVAGLVQDLASLQDRVVDIKLKRSGTESLEALVKDLGELHDKTVALKVDVQGDEVVALNTTIDALKSRSALSLAVDVKGDDVKALSDSIAALQGNSRLSLDVDVKGDNVKALTDSITALQSNSKLALSVDIKGDSIAAFSNSIEALQGNTKLSLDVDIKGDSITAFSESIAALQSKTKLALDVDVRGDEINALLATIAEIRSKAITLDMQVAGGDFKEVIGVLDRMRSEVVNVKFGADISGLAAGHDRIEDFNELAHRGIVIPISAEADGMAKMTASLNALEKLNIQVEVDRAKLTAAVDLIQSRLNPEDFIAKLTIDTADLDGSLRRLREAQKELTAYNKEVSSAFQTRSLQDMTTERIRAVKELQGEEEARIRRTAMLERVEGAKTINELRSLAKELQITPTMGTKRADYEAMLRDFLAIEDAARRVSDAWKITGRKFDDIQDEMKAKAEHVGNAIFEAENHGAADLVKFAWERTGKAFSNIQNRMAAQAEKAGKQISEALDAAAKDRSFKLTVDSKTAKKDLGDFQNYAKLLIKNDLDFGINTAKSKYNIGELLSQLEDLKRAKASAAKEDKAYIAAEIAGIEDQIAAYKSLVRAAREEARERTDALDTQSKSYKILIANQEELERTTKATSAVMEAAANKQRQQAADAINDASKIAKLNESIAAAKRIQIDKEAASVESQRVSAEEAARQRVAAEFNFDQQLSKLNQQRSAARQKFRADEAAAEQKRLDDGYARESKQWNVLQDMNRKIREAHQRNQEKQEKADQAALDRKLAAMERSVNRAAEINAKATADQQKQQIADRVLNKDTKITADGGVGIAGIGANLSSVQKLQEKLEAVRRTIRDLEQDKIDLKIDDNFPAFRAALDKLRKEEIVLTAKINVDEKGGAGGGLKGALKGIGQDFLQAFNLDLTSVVQGAIQGYQAVFGGLVGIAKSSLAEFGAIQATAQKTATLLTMRDPGVTEDNYTEKRIANQERLRKVIQQTSISSGNLFAGKEIGLAAADLAKAGATIEFIEANMTRLATAATASGEKIEKVSNTSLAFATKFGDAADGAVEKFKKQEVAVKGTTFALTSAKLSADNFLKTIQYSNPISRTTEAMKNLVADTAAFARIGVAGSKTGTNLNTVFKTIAKTLDGTSKKAADNREKFAEMEAVIGKIDYSKFKDESGNIKESVSSLGALVEMYKKYEASVGSSKARAMFEDVFGVQGMNAITNSVSILGEERQKIADQLEGIVKDTKDVFTKRFADSMKEGFEGGIARLGNIRDTYKEAIGSALAPVAGGIMTLFAEVTERSFKLGGKGLADQIDRIKNKFESFGSNEALINNLALAFNRVSEAVGGRLLSLIERLANYLSDDKNVMELADGISFWLTATIDAFTTATELIIGMGVAASKVGAALAGVTYQPLTPVDSANLGNALKAVVDLDTSMASIRGESKAYALDIEAIKKQLNDETGQVKLTTEERIKLTEKLAEYERKQAGLLRRIELENKELDRQRQIVTDIKAKQNEPSKQDPKITKSILSMEGAMQVWTNGLKLWADLGIGDDLKLIYDQLIAPALASQVSVLGFAFQALGIAVKLALTPLTGFALLSKVEFSDFGYAIKQTNQEFTDWAAGGLKQAGDAIGGMSQRLAQFVVDNSTSTSAAGQAWTTVTTGLGDVWNATMSGLTSAWNTTTTNISTTWSIVTTGLGNVWNATVAGLTAAWNATTAYLASSWNTVTTGLDNVWRSFAANVGSVFAQARANVIANLQAIANRIIEIARSIPGIFGAAWNAAAQGVNQIGSTIQSVFSNAWANVQQGAANVVQGFRDAWGNAIGDIGGRIGGLIDQARSIPVVGALIPGRAAGGIVPGPASKTDNVIIAARGGEGVLVPEAVAALGGEAGLFRLNRQAEAGRLPGYAAGGVVSSPLSALTVPGGQTTAEYLKQNKTTAKQPPIVVKVLTAPNPATAREQALAADRAKSDNYELQRLIREISKQLSQDKNLKPEDAKIIATAQAKVIMAGRTTKTGSDPVVSLAKTTETATALAKVVAIDQNSYWTRSLRALNDLYAGLVSISNKISQLKIAFAQPAASYGAGTYAGGAAATASNPLTVFNKGVLAQGGTASGKTEIKVSKTGKKDSEGLEILRMDLVEVGTGRIVDSVLGNSGVPSLQRYTDADSKYGNAGSLLPVPKGKYAIEKTTSSNAEGIGGWFVPLGGAGENESGRSAFGIHMDANRAMKPGSAGCIVLYDPAAKSRVQAWLNNANAPKELSVSYGTSTPIDGSTINIATSGSGTGTIGGKGAYKGLLKIRNDADLYQTAIVAITEGLASSVTSQVDSAVSIANRVNAGTFGANAQAVVSAPGQYEAYSRFGLSGVRDRASAEAKLRSLGYSGDTLDKFLKALEDNTALMNSVQHLKGSTNYRAYVPGQTLAARAGDPQRSKNDNYYIPGGDSYASISAAQAKAVYEQSIKALKSAPAASKPAARNDVKPFVNAALGSYADSDPNTIGQDEIAKRLAANQVQRDILVQKANAASDTKARKALDEQIKLLDTKTSDLRATVNASNRIDNANTQVENRQTESAYNDALAALNAQARELAGTKEQVKENAAYAKLIAQRDEYERELALALERQQSDLVIFDRQQAANITRAKGRKGATQKDIDDLIETQRLLRVKKVGDLAESVTEARKSLEGKNTDIVTYQQRTGLDDRADRLAEIIALQKRAREQTIDQQELNAAMKRLGIAQVNGQFVLDKATNDQLTALNKAKDVDRQQGQLEKLLRGQGLVFKDALFEALDLEYNYYLQKRDTELNKASQEQLSFLYSKGMLRTGSIEGGSYVNGAPGAVRDSIGEYNIDAEQRIRENNLRTIQARYESGKYTGEQAQALANSLGGNIETIKPGYNPIEVIKAGANPASKQSLGKKLATLSEVPYTTSAELNAAMRENIVGQTLTGASSVATSAAAAGSSGYMAKPSAPFRIKLDLPVGTDERITSVVRQTEDAMNSSEFTTRMLGEFVSILRSDPQLMRQLTI